MYLGQRIRGHWITRFIISLLPSGRFKWLNWLAIISSLWLLFYPEPRAMLFVIVIVLPILGLAINRIYFKGIESLMTIELYKTYNRSKATVSIATFIKFPAFILLFKSFLYNCGDYLKLFEVGSIGFLLGLVLIFALYGFISSENPDRLGIYFFILPLMAIYSYSATYIINCEFDNSKPKAVTTNVIDKYSSTGKNSGYYLVVKDIVRQGRSDNVKVSYDVYQSKQQGSLIRANYFKGLLNIPWYYYEAN